MTITVINSIKVNPRQLRVQKLGAGETARVDKEAGEALSM
jgi:hypothetical protein